MSSVPLIRYTVHSLIGLAPNDVVKAMSCLMECHTEQYFSRERAIGSLAWLYSFFVLRFSLHQTEGCDFLSP